MRKTDRVSRAVRHVGGLVFACLALAPAAAASADTPTFSKDVAPIFQRACQSCHRPGNMAPMSLLTYEDARPWARAIRTKVVKREMPPWFIDKTVGIQGFKNDPSLTDAEVDTIIRWVDGGGPAGNSAHLPKAAEWPDDEAWTIGTPDLIVSSPPHKMYARGPDVWLDFLVETKLKEDRYIRSIETKPSKGGRRIVHHASTYLIQADDSTVQNAFGDSIKPDERSGGRLGEFAPGKPGDMFPEDTGILIKAGSTIRFQMHYFANGEEITDSTRIGLVFYPKEATPKYRVIDPNMGGGCCRDLDIPANTVTRHDAYFPVKKPARVISYQPHMHMRGKAQIMEAIYPDGKSEILSSVDRFDFNWHIPYIYNDDVAPLLPAGTIIHYIAIHDNTASNPRNPDPTQWVGYGDRSIDDMFQVHLNLVYLEEADFARQVKERAAAKAKKSN
jgi:hypothetical protein